MLALLSATKSPGDFWAGGIPPSPFSGTQRGEEGGGINLIGLAFGIWPPSSLPKSARARKARLERDPRRLFVFREKGGMEDGMVNGMSGCGQVYMGWAYCIV